MPASEKRKDFPFDRPGKYHIRVQGFLDERWSDRLGGMHITAYSPKDQAPVTMLAGRVHDQAELVGVLNTLYELHLTLLSVEYIDGD
jgi:hypothetical protein